MVYCNILTFAFLLFIPLSVLKKSVTIEGNKKLFLLFFALFVFQILGLVYTNDFKAGLFSTEKRLALLVFPLVFFCTDYDLSNKEIKKLFLSFQLGLSLCALYCLLNAFKENFLLNQMAAIDWTLFSDKLMDPAGINHLAFGLYSALAVAYAVHNLLQFPEKKTVFLEIAMLLPISISLIFVIPKMAIISLLVGICYLFVQNRSAFSGKHIIGITIAFGILMIIVLQLPKSRERMRQFTYGFGRNNVINDKHSYSATRAGALYATLDLLAEHGISGLGTGGIDKEMTDWYMAKGVPDLIGIDTHNQYFDYWLSYGLLGLILFSGSLLIPLWIAHKEGNELYVVFLIIMLISFLTENFLNNNKGIMFFSFFNSLFAGLLNHKKNVVRENT